MRILKYFPILALFYGVHASAFDIYNATDIEVQATGPKSYNQVIKSGKVGGGWDTDNKVSIKVCWYKTQQIIKFKGKCATKKVPPHKQLVVYGECGKVTYNYYQKSISCSIDATPKLKFD